MHHLIDWKLEVHLRNKFNFWSVHEIMNISGLLQSKWSPTGRNRSKFNLFLIFTFYIISQVSIFNCYLTWLVFWIFWIRYVQANVSKGAAFLDGVDVYPPKWRVCGCCLNWSVHKGMNDISNIKVYMKIRSGM